MRPANGAFSPSAMLVGVTGTGSPAANRAVERRAQFGLDRDHAHAVADRRLDAADQPAAADRDDHRVGVGGVLLDLETDGALAGEDERVVERMHERAAGLFDQRVQPLERLARARSPRGRPPRRSRAWPRSSARTRPAT